MENGNKETVQTNEEAMSIGVGTKETVALAAAEVLVSEVAIEEQTDKTGKRIGDKIVLTCKHPDKDELIKISSVKYEKNNQIKVTGIWFNKDEEGKIQKGSALALMMDKLVAKTINDFKGKSLPTTQDAKGYLCIKVY